MTKVDKQKNSFKMNNENKAQEAVDYEKTYGDLIDKAIYRPSELTSEERHKLLTRKVPNSYVAERISEMHQTTTGKETQGQASPIAAAPVGLKWVKASVQLPPIASKRYWLRLEGTIPLFGEFLWDESFSTPCGRYTKNDNIEWLSETSLPVSDAPVGEAEIINQLALEMLTAIHKVIHAIQHSNMKGTILHAELTAVCKKAMNSPLKVRHGSGWRSR